MSDAADSASQPAADPPVSARNPWHRAVRIFVTILLVYFVVAYLLMPLLWRRFAHRHPAIDDTPGITLTGDKHPGDPINVALIGSEEQVKQIMQAAGWFPADPLGLRSDVKIAADTVLKRPYDDAPVSNLYLFGRKEDLAFEQPVGDDPRQRHHVRFWKSAKVDDEGRPLWAGSATYDKRVGLSHTTGQVTHHISGDVDAERDHLFADLQKTGKLIDVQFIDDFHKVREGVNGGGDRWYTDGRLEVGTIRAAATR
ncbi:MAG TPA: LssY C-terminal domain-containing protein [Pirellulaceae bacterium]|nr:LssY C-terminal domain-containing protein [Pirellulaceae bacterium]